MAEGFDAIVVGLGGMGSAALFHLATKGARVLGLDQFVPPHDRGSSHGLSRIIRLAYWEHPIYVPLVRRAYELWRELEITCGIPLLTITGSLDIGSTGGRLYGGALQSAIRYGLPHEDLSAREVTERFPGFRLPSSVRAIYQPDGGYLRPEQAILAHLALASGAGAEIHTGERVVGWTASDEGVVVTTNARTYRCGQLVITAGPWNQTVLAGRIPLGLVPERQVVIWTKPLTDAFRPGHVPVFYMEMDEGRFYGFPEDDVGFKIGKYHHLGQVVNPDEAPRDVTPQDLAVLMDAVAKYFPGANGEVMRAETCLFTNTPDEHFAIGRVPGTSNVLMAGGCSGHAFKFCSVIGEVLGDLALRGTSAFDLTLFDPGRTLRR